VNPLYATALGLVNRTSTVNGQPFDPLTPVPTRRGTGDIVHYGVMVPGLPEPIRFLDVIVILGTARAPIFGVSALLEGPAADAAWLLTGSGVDADSFARLSVDRDCELAGDGAHMRFGKQLTVDRRGGRIAVRIDRPTLSAELELAPTRAVSHFARIPGVYDHWSVLCRYAGQVRTDAETVDIAGLCTWEYARAKNLPLPFRSFAYHVLTLDDSTQALVSEVLGPGGLPVLQAVYLRHVDGRASVHTRDFTHTVVEWAAHPLTTPDGHEMRMPHTVAWSVQDDDGAPLLDVSVIANGDFTYGLGAGYAGSCRFTGTYRGRPVEGTSYLEWITR